MRGLLLTVALALAVVAAAACGGAGGAGGGAEPAQRPASPASVPADRLRIALDSAYAFLDAHTGEDGRVRRPDQGGDTVSEGQAYAMLAAAAVGDGERFDRIWTWTRENLQRDDDLLAFRWADGRVADAQPATDADLDAARALLVASCRFGRPDLRQDALELGRAILAHEVARSGDARLLAAGPFGTEGAVVVNPSYLDPVSLTALARASGDATYARVLDDTRRAVAEVSAPLPPDWAVVVDGALRPADSAQAAADGQAGAGRYGFDAPRTLLRLAVDPDPAGRRIAAEAWPVFQATPPRELVVEHAVDGSPAGDSRNAVAQVGAAGAAHAAGDRSAAAALLDAGAAVQQETPTYYGAAMVALGRLLLQTDRLEPGCPGKEMS